MPTISPELKRKHNRKARIWRAILFFIPMGNPDFDDFVDDVQEWILEIDNADKSPTREIGLNANGQPICIMPWNKNYGYWTDNEIKLDYFTSNLKAIPADEKEFEALWTTFSKQNN